MEVHQEDVMIMEEMKMHIKGKRSKRPRPSSALTLTIASTSSSSSTTTTTTDGAPPTNSNIDFTTILQDNHDNNDEYVANCLILLAHGQYLPPSDTRLYVYECKTCSRGFTSFQALGGHRASHKKPHKDVREISKNRTSLWICPNKPLSCNPSGSTKGPKVHECSICGSHFTSGQALGGHMRRHRSVMPTTTYTSTTTTCTTSDEHHKSKKHKTLLPLDLNLPAPIEDDHNETKSPFGLNNQIIVFSTPSLVDCHF
ncbi:zinc finger protein ZAT5-like [Cynara cardunculus var. scolymus]|uniref:Zinc finger, C2H2 n=1 Tax=Cynara cardunculus var. scolymus TaxID=59895 RepID=A0A103D5B0_CYNCS|nr:zinc finger protein ZAT5-like [Cynara cardunculus var. scolymus]KVD98103.1 Zinc finger, C2H2 [Cynara cardunculus var. scolymus]